MADSRPRAARIAHAGLPPAAFPTQPSLDRLAILSVQDGSIRLKLRPLSLGKQPKTARLSINRDSFKESSPALLAVAQRHCFSLEACSPTGHALITAVHDAPACLQMWQLPGCSEAAVLELPARFQVIAVRWAPDSSRIAITLEQRSSHRRALHLYDAASGAALGSAVFNDRNWRCGLIMDPRTFAWQPSPASGECLAGFADDALLLLRGADCSVLARVPVAELQGGVPPLRKEGNVSAMCFAWVPGSGELACYVEHGLISLTCLTYMTIAAGGVETRMEIAPYSVCQPVFGAQAIAGVTGAAAEVVIGHSCADMEIPMDDRPKPLQTGLFLGEARGSDTDASLLAWAPNGQLLCVGKLETGSSGLLGLAVHLFSLAAQQVMTCSTSLFDLCAGLRVHDPFLGYNPGGEGSGDKRVVWSADGRAVSFSLQLADQAVQPNGSVQPLTVSCHYIVALPSQV